MKYCLFAFLLLFVGLKAQIITDTQDSVKVVTEKADTLVVDSGVKDSLRIFKPTIEDYKVYTQFSEKKPFDTTFSIQQYYQFTQYNNEDNFGKIQFANIGAGFQNLVYENNAEQNFEVLPTNKSYGIISADQVRYYDVKTPTATFFYHNAMSNGAALKSTYTQNIGKNINIALEYMGLRSQGFYDRSLTANNTTIFSANYKSKNGKYEAFAHFLHQNVNAEEYGGIADLSVFLSNESEFKNRENLDVNLDYSDSRFSYRRYYFSHTFRPFSSEKFPFKIRHTIYHQGNKYYYNQSALEPYYYDESSEIVTGMPLNAKKYSKNLSNTVSLLWDHENFKLEAGVRHQNIQLGTNNVQLRTNPYDPVTYKENRFGALGKINIRLWNKFDLESFAEFSNGNEFGNFLKWTNHASFQPIQGYKAEAFLNFQSAAPSFNYLLNNSPYIKYNYRFSDFENQNVLEAGGKINLKFFDSSVFAKYYKIDRFTYFNSDAMPAQSNSTVNISQIGGEATLHYRKFHLNTKLLFQSTLSNKDLFPAPNFIGRLNLYWQSKAFKKAAELQAGIKTYYFSKFSSRNYSPILNEFILPDATSYSIGGQPIADVYINMKVKRMFFFIEGQHLNNSFMKNESYTAPYYPIYDFRVNIGIVWYMFH